MSNVNFKIDGNIISPKGGSAILVKEATDDFLNIKTESEETWNPYNIVYIEDDMDESYPASQVGYTPSVTESDNVQDALSELETAIYEKVYTITSEVINLSDGDTSFTVTNKFTQGGLMVYYNGLLINNGVNYTYSSSTKTVSFMDFQAEAGDTATVVGLIAPTGVVTNDQTHLIGEAY